MLHILSHQCTIWVALNLCSNSGHYRVHLFSLKYGQHQLTSRNSFNFFCFFLMSFFFFFFFTFRLHVLFEVTFEKIYMKFAWHLTGNLGVSLIMRLSWKSAGAVEALIDRDQWTHLAGGNTTITGSQGLSLRIIPLLPWNLSRYVA